MGLDITFFKLKGVKDSSKTIEDYVDNYADSIRNHEEVAYFLKVNFLYNYFKDKYEENALADKASIQALKDICLDVLKHNDEEYSKEHLPTCSGFGFGSTEYDECYYYDVKDCFDEMSYILKDFDDDNDVILVNFWWNNFNERR